MSGFAYLLDKSVKIVAATLVAAIVAITLAQVVMRYFFGIALPWAAELAQVILVYTVMIVAAHAAGRNAHFAVGILPERIAPRYRPALVWFNRLLIGIFAAVAFVYGVRLSLGQMATILPALGVPVGTVYMALPLGASLTILHLICVRPSAAPEREA